MEEQRHYTQDQVVEEVEQLQLEVQEVPGAGGAGGAGSANQLQDSPVLMQGGGGGGSLSGAGAGGSGGGGEVVLSPCTINCEQQELLTLEVEEVEIRWSWIQQVLGGSGGSGIVIVRGPGSAYYFSKPRYKHSYNITRTSWWL
jgi:hypothetical protein